MLALCQAFFFKKNGATNTEISVCYAFYVGFLGVNRVLQGITCLLPCFSSWLGLRFLYSVLSPFFLAK